MTEVASYQLKSDLARVCLPSHRDNAHRRLAWVNSVCVFFLIIGILGARPQLPLPKHPPPIEQAIPVIVEPLAAPPPSAEPKQVEPQNDEKQIAPQVVAVTLNTPAIDFSVPTVGNIVVPMAAAVAPPPVELRQQAPTRQAPMMAAQTGEGGDRPAPSAYPELAQQLGQQGTVMLQFTVDDVGKITSISVKKSSGSSILDRDALNWVRRHWIQPPTEGCHGFLAPIRYQLQ
ncbi:MAG TPA: TonB family protein [Verrucomicrobiae bacterium]|jgi:protein TonB|nr:TonB family protein [Verrucomicrobiae bacterium]